MLAMLAMVILAIVLILISGDNHYQYVSGRVSYLSYIHGPFHPKP